MKVENILNILPIDSKIYFTGLNNFESFLMNVLDIPEIFHDLDCIRFEYDTDWDCYKLEVNSELTYILIWKEHEKLCSAIFHSDTEVISAMKYYAVNSDLYVGESDRFDRVLTYDEKTGKIERNIINKLINGKDFLDLLK